MSARQKIATAPAAKGKPVTLSSLAEKKALGEPIAMVTAYDHPSAQVAEAAGVDVVLVGDSAAMTVLGYPSTVPVTVEEMLMLAAAVRRGLRTPLLVGDLPFGSYEVSNEQAVATAQRFVKEAGCDAVKLERGGSSVDRARAIVAAGIPVMGHVGLTPQTATALGGYRSQGRTAERALEVALDARALEDAGFLIERLREPTHRIEDPRHDRIPLFLQLRALKPRWSTCATARSWRRRARRGRLDAPRRMGGPRAKLDPLGA